MQLEFHRTHQALNSTIEYYGIQKIKEHMDGFANPSRKPSYIDDWYDLVFKMHRFMENEIQQIIVTHTDTAKVLYFENLKEWRSYYQIESLWIPDIIHAVNTYNENTCSEFELEVEKKIIEFQKRPEFKLDNGVEYETEQINNAIFWQSRGLLGVEKKKLKKINRKFYCIENKPDLIDTSFLQQYFSLVNALLVNVRRILDKYIALYNEGKILSNEVITTEKKALPSSESKNVFEIPSKPIKKIKTSLKVEQIGYLYKMLNDAGIIQAATFKEIHEFIANNFTVISKNEDEDISIGKLARIWSDFNAKTAAYWMDKFIHLRNQASKDNPNNIKLDA